MWINILKNKYGKTARRKRISKINLFLLVPTELLLAEDMFCRILQHTYSVLPPQSQPIPEADRDCNLRQQTGRGCLLLSSTSSPLIFLPIPEKERGTKKRRCEEEEEEDELEEHILCSLALYSPLMHASSSIQCTSSFCNPWCGRNRGGHIICGNSFIALLALGLGQPCLYTRKIAHPIACLLDWI